MMTLKMEKFMKVCKFGLVGCSLAFGVVGTAFAGDTTPAERAAEKAFHEKPYVHINWTAEQLRAGAEYAARLDSSNPFSSEEGQPYASVRWTSDQLRAGVEYAALMSTEGPVDDGKIADLKARMKGSDNTSFASKK